MSKKLTKN